MIKVFGLKNCDTCRNALIWLEKNNIECAFFDLRGVKLDLKNIERWVDEVGWELLLNRRSKTWRNLPEHETRVIDEKLAVRLMFENVTLIKRPIFEIDEQVLLGFKDRQKRILIKQR